MHWVNKWNQWMDKWNQWMKQMKSINGTKKTLRSAGRGLWFCGFWLRWSSASGIGWCWSTGWPSGLFMHHLLHTMVRNGNVLDGYKTNWGLRQFRTQKKSYCSDSAQEPQSDRVITIRAIKDLHCTYLKIVLFVQWQGLTVAFIKDIT